MKQINVRTCAGCGIKKNKSEFLRITKLDGKIFVDISKKAQGRGLYICYNSDCIKKLTKNKKLVRTYKTFIEPDFYESIERDFLNE